MQLDFYKLNLYLEYATMRLDLLESEINKLIHDWETLLMQQSK